MGLINCPDCGKQISSRALQCPFCGCPAEFFEDNTEKDVIETITEKTSETKENKTQTQNMSMGDMIKALDSGHNDEKSASNGSDDNTSKRSESVQRSIIADESAKRLEANTQGCLKDDATINEDMKEKGVEFGLKTEQFPNSKKHSFTVIIDPERETDKHAKGKTHVLFRVGNNKYLTVSKDNLFYAPIEKDVNAECINAISVFKEYLDGVTSLSGMTSGVKDKAEAIINEFCQYLVNKLIQYGIYEYDIRNFISQCGSRIRIQETTAYKSILSQKDSVNTYAQNLAYQRNLERSSRSQWSGGGFGVKGAIKGAITAGALNAATGAFRSIGDGISDAGDRSSVQNQYDSIVNYRNKTRLWEDFASICLYRAKENFYFILSDKTGWSAAEVLEENWNEADAKFNNLERIDDIGTRERILIELISEHPYHYKVLDYALSNYTQYGFDLDDLLHFVKRISLNSIEQWKAGHFSDSLNQIVECKIGEERKQAIKKLAITFGIIDEDYNITQGEDITYGSEVIMSLMESDMADFGLSLNNIEDQTGDYDKAEFYFEKLFEVGDKYHVLKSVEKKEVKLVGILADDDKFVDLESDTNEQLARICTVRGITCGSIQEAKLLAAEWDDFDGIYTPFESYADYDSCVMQEVINAAQSKNYTSQYVLDLISGEKGLIRKKQILEEREQSDVYKKSQQLVELMLPYVENDLYVYGSDGFLLKAKTVRTLDRIKELESDIYPLVIYDASDSSGFKGFVVTDKYFYNFNSKWGIGFGDKAISLYDVLETAQSGNSRFFKLSNGKTDKIKMTAYEDLIIGTLSEVFSWKSDLTRASSLTSQSVLESDDLTHSAEVIKDKKKCPSCGNMVIANAKFCTKCGSKISDEIVEERVPCSNCGKMIKINSKFCTFCGTTIADIRDELPE